ncbi:HAD family hydrolase [Paludifilum halophilum]|uniref:Phosphatase n=1 Tax=Paludifilum halophilum TaxID=1642702 RepID=A0A235BA24_9BACL|nr:HAD family hydrolase [Paludifilum halophilum]OYD09144.1 hypothetical protein CHM34_05120 [Paludifilum halophilum]
MYQVILFDVDGVLLSEKRCFDATTLSVWELLYSEHALALPGESFHADPDEEEIGRVRQAVFDHEKVLEWLKSRGMNSNWDMVSLLFGFQLQQLLRQLDDLRPDFVEEVLNRPLNRKALQMIGDQAKQAGVEFHPRFGDILSVLEDAGPGEMDLLSCIVDHVEDWSGIKGNSFSHGSALWKLGREVYQEWYLGKDLFEKEEKKQAVYPEKEGFLRQEIPLADPAIIRDMLDELSNRGIALGIGTGRPARETQVPLKEMNLYDAFDSNRVVTASDVRGAEEIYADYAPLSKPEPFTYVKAYFGSDSSDAKSVAADLPLPSGEEILIVGDSVADLLAARKMGCRFAATLTGPTGERARSKFEEMGADYILKDVTELADRLKQQEEERARREELEREKENQSEEESV